MTLFRSFLALFLLLLTAFTLVVVWDHGLNLLPRFFGDIAEMGWPGQFNLDFFGFLLLSGIWTLWRNGLTRWGIFLSVLAIFGGMMFLTIYLLILSFANQGNPQKILLGIHYAAQSKQGEY